MKPILTLAVFLFGLGLGLVWAIQAVNYMPKNEPELEDLPNSKVKPIMAKKEQKLEL